MRAPTEFELQHLLGDFARAYDPVKAHEYYERTKKLKGRRRGSSQPTSNGQRPSGQDPRTGLTREKIAQNAKAKQRKELAARIQSLEGKLRKLEAKIREMEHEEASEDRRGKAKQERAAKEREKPKTAAEKAEAARESEKYREKHQQELKTKAKEASDKSGGGSSKKSGSKTETVSQLRSLATKVKGQIAVAKQKLAAL
jgi:hypothetical protein